MFESITFFNQNKTDTSNPLDIGALVECMLFHILWGQVYFLTFFGVRSTFLPLDNQRRQRVLLFDVLMF